MDVQHPSISPPLAPHQKVSALSWDVDYAETLCYCKRQLQSPTLENHVEKVFPKENTDNCHFKGSYAGDDLKPFFFLVDNLLVCADVTVLTSLVLNVLLVSQQHLGSESVAVAVAVGVVVLGDMCLVAHRGRRDGRRRLDEGPGEGWPRDREGRLYSGMLCR